MADKIEGAVEKAMKLVDGLCGPRAMTKAEAVDYLERIIDRCRSSIEALREEMADDE